MTIDERRQRIHAIAELIDEVVDDADRFCLIIFPAIPPEQGRRVQFDIISNAKDREYVATVLENVVAGIDADLEHPVEDRQPN